MEEREIQYFEQFGETIQDEYGGLYSADGVWLLLAPIGKFKNYKIKEGTQIIAEHSFSGKGYGDYYFEPSDIVEVEHGRAV